MDTRQNRRRRWNGAGVVVGLSLALALKRRGGHCCTRQPAAASAPLLLAEAQRQLTSQEGSLTEVRTRALALLSLAGIVSGVAGAVAGKPTARYWVPAGFGLAFLLVSVALALVIHFPRRQGWTFAGTVTTTGNGFETDQNLWALDRTKWIEVWRQRNKPQIEAMYGRLRWLIIAVFLTVTSWTLAAILAA